jgi:hypothetical protein
MIVVRPDFDPSLAAALAADHHPDHALVSYLTDGRVILVHHLYASLTAAQHSALDALTENSVYYDLPAYPEYSGPPIIRVHAGLICDLASIPTWLGAWMQRDRLPESALVHDALYAELRWRQQQRRWSAATCKSFRLLADQIFRRHLTTQQPPIRRTAQWAIYWAVRIFGHRPRPT